MPTLACWWLSIRFDEYLMLCGYFKGFEFEVEDRVFLKLSPWKGVVRVEKRGKLNPRSSMLRKYIPDPSHGWRHQRLS